VRFLDPSADLGPAFAGSYSGTLVLTSYLVAALASYAGLLLSERILESRSVAARRLWLTAGAATLGFGVWSMHFIGMLAFSLPMPISYDATITAVSVLPVIVASTFGLRVMAYRRPGRAQKIVAGTVLGLGIGIMHYTGMEAMVVNADMRYDPLLFVLSGAVAIMLGIVAVYVHDYKRRVSPIQPVDWLQPWAAAIMGLAITGMHYTAMQATFFFAPSERIDDLAALDPILLSLAVTVISVLITLTAIIASISEQRIRQLSNFSKLTRQQLTEAVESISDGFVLFDGNGRLMMCNSNFRRMHPSLNGVLAEGVSYGEVLRTSLGNTGAASPDSTSNKYFAECLRRIEGGLEISEAPQEEQLEDGRWIYIRQHKIKGGGIVGVWTDVTPIKELQAHFERKAHHDELTGLPNRHLFEDRLAQTFARARRNGTPCALLYLDLDEFKPINDTYGHNVGDAVLVEVARRLQRALRESDTVARLGGDEFAVILEPTADHETAELAAARILEGLELPFALENGPCTVGISIGIGIAMAAVTDKERLLKAADEAMYEAKKVKGNSIRIRELLPD
jgi:diguanylate cyclase (GGDEF)-like protein